MHPGVLEVVQIRPTAEDVRVKVGLHLRVPSAARMLPSSTVQASVNLNSAGIFFRIKSAHEFPAFNRIRDQKLHHSNPLILDPEKVDKLKPIPSNAPSQDQPK